MEEILRGQDQEDRQILRSAQWGLAAMPAPISIGALAAVQIAPISAVVTSAHALDFNEEIWKPPVMFMILLAAQVAAPDPQNSDRWFSGNDVPQYLIRRPSAVWIVPVRMDVSPDGRMQGCQAETTGPVPELNDYTCSIIRRRAKFRPARLDDNPTYGVYRTVIRYVVADSPLDTSRFSFPDIELDVEHLPAGLKSPASVQVAFAVDAGGEKSNCNADEAADPKYSENDPSLVAIACREVMAKYRATAAMVSGRPIASVQNATVDFLMPRASEVKHTGSH